MSLYLPPFGGPYVSSPAAGGVVRDIICGAQVRPGMAVCPGCGMELPWRKRSRTRDPNWGWGHTGYPVVLPDLPPYNASPPIRICLHCDSALSYLGPFAMECPQCEAEVPPSRLGVGRDNFLQPLWEPGATPMPNWLQVKADYLWKRLQQVREARLLREAGLRREEEEARLQYLAEQPTQLFSLPPSESRVPADESVVSIAAESAKPEQKRSGRPPTRGASPHRKKSTPCLSSYVRRGEGPGSSPSRCRSRRWPLR
jgi:hypothetical protein